MGKPEPVVSAAWRCAPLLRGESSTIEVRRGSLLNEFDDPRCRVDHLGEEKPITLRGHEGADGVVATQVTPDLWFDQGR
ncbi:MAG: hypothetical protein ACE5GB_04255 [Acidimicrobiales bacterium]